VYPLLSTGDLADLHQDWADAEKPAKKNRTLHPQHALESISVQPTPPTLLKLTLLLRLGETEIVQKIAPLLQKEATSDLYLELASDWTWFAFERAVCAHERGDDRLCLLDCQLLTKLQPVVEAEVKRRGIPQPTDSSNSHFPDRKLPYLPFLKQLDLLLKDTERRLAPSQQAPPPKDSIEALIDDLQNVGARQDGQPGGVTLAFDPRVQALVKRGDEIVEPLLKAMEHDTRLTRSVSFGRDFFRSRRLISVSEAAFATLQDFLQVDFKTNRKEDGEPLSRREQARQIRDYWARMGNLPPSERFYATLKDDQADPDQWLQAAASLVQPTDVERHGWWTIFPTRKPDQKIVMRGEVLRDGRSPSVSELLAKRSDDIAAIRTHSSNDHFLFIHAGQMAIHLASWDQNTAIPVLKRRLQRAWNIGAEPHDILAFNTTPSEFFGNIIVKMTLARVQCGDQTAYDEYSTWIRQVDLKNVGFAARDLLKPLSQGADHPSIATAIHFLFNDPASPWSNVLDQRNGIWQTDFWKSQLPKTEGFRQQALRGLTDQSAVGSVKCVSRTDGKGGYLNVSLAGGGFWLRDSGSDPEEPQIGEERAFRVCDAFAYFYSQYQDGPEFQLYWSEQKRNAGVAACLEWLETKESVLK